MKTHRAVPCLAICLVLPWDSATAQNTLTVPVELVRRANPDLSTPSSGNVTILRISPRYTIQNVDGNTTTEWSFGGTIERSSNTDLSANRSLPQASVTWQNATAVSTVTLRGSLEEASTRESEFTEFGRVTRDSTERVGLVGATWAQELDAGSRWEIGATHRRVSYDTPAFRDFNETTGAVTYGSDMSPKSRFTLTGSATRVNPEDGAQNATRYGIGAGYETDLTEAMTFLAGVGVARTNYIDSKIRPVGSLRLLYEGERVLYNLGWSRDISAGGSLGGFARSETYGAEFTWRLSEDRSVSLGYDRAESLDGARDAGSTAYARFQSTLSQFWTMTLGVEQRRAFPALGPSARGHSLTIGFTYSHPDL